MLITILNYYDKNHRKYKFKAYIYYKYYYNLILGLCPSKTPYKLFRKVKKEGS